MRVAGQQIKDVSEGDQPQDVGKENEEEDSPDVVNVFIGQLAQVGTDDLVANERAHRLEQLRQPAFGPIGIQAFTFGPNTVGNEGKDQQHHDCRKQRHRQVIGDVKLVLTVLDEQGGDIETGTAELKRN